MTIQLRHDDTPNLHSIRKGLCLVVACLADVRIHHKDDVVGLDGFLNLLHLLEQGHLLLVPPARVDDDQVVLLLLEELNTLLRDFDWVSLVVVSVERDADLGGVLLQLVEGPGPEGVAADQGGFPTLPVVVVRVLGASGGLAAALQADKHDDIALSLLQLVRLLVCRDQPHQLLNHGLLNQLALVDTTSVGFQENTLLNVGPQLRDVANVDVGVQQRGCDLLQHLIQELIVDDGRCVQFPEGSCDLRAKI
mmetsp:Transcript_69714/g.176911  ORF Transcript_69714/g.176911 Transcript_69714/m.176911 type:complete len:250 (+) Transcript_69714:985-1734(+)